MGLKFVKNFIVIQISKKPWIPSHFVENIELEVRYLRKKKNI